MICVVGLVLCLYPWLSSIAVKSETHPQSISEDILGSIEIPKINVNLPVYQGTDEETLKKGVGHISWSSPPIGGINTHSLLAGHRGLPGALLFTRLNELKEGDLFYIKINKKTLVYKVCNIKVVKPEETEELSIQEGRDLLSLVTCTPYGINTHRLVVTGERM